ncbi:MAG: hypothetical protein EBZ76_01530 [Synechococcaceae bacterium WB9_2_170]|nr:hypothetical protein [Synechococcaceae bacterium WB9_2_170]
MLLALVLLLVQGPQAQAAGPAQPPETKPAAANPGPLEKLRPLLKPSVPSGLLQEVAAPIAVQQIQDVLADRQPRITIEAPSDGANLPSGNWTLKLNVQDWPLHDGGALGIGPHVVVQIDDQAPVRLTEHRSGPKGQAVQLTLPPLAPGSHRITTYAATPWGEAARTPGATSQIRVHRVAANPLTLPEAGSPQVLGVSPMGTVGGEPVLLDWLLLDAPLQHLRDNDGSWRLRITINDDRFVVDQNVPLWLKGWKTGSNSLQLDLVDGRGKPLNPPFNSLVSEVVLKPATNQPRWQQGRLSAAEMVALLGQAPPPAKAAAPKPAPKPSRNPAPTNPAAKEVESKAADPKANPSDAKASVAKDSPANGSDAIASKAAESKAAESEAVEAGSSETDSSEAGSGEPEALDPEAPEPEALDQGEKFQGDKDQPDTSQADTDQADIGQGEIDQGELDQGVPDPEGVDPVGVNRQTAVPAEQSPAVEANPLGAGSLADDDTIDRQSAAPPEDALATTKGVAIQGEAASEPGISGEPEPEQTSQELGASSATSPIPPQAPEASSTPGQTKPIANPDRVSPSSNVVGTAREQVREDGSLIKPKRQGLWGGLLDRLGA